MRAPWPHDIDWRQLIAAKAAQSRAGHAYELQESNSGELIWFSDRNYTANRALEQLEFHRERLPPGHTLKVVHTGTGEILATIDA